MIAEGVEQRGERRRLGRHARHCTPCRRHARELGVDPFGRRPWQSRVGALLPLGWLLRRGAESKAGEAMLFGGGQLTTGLAERAAALVAAGALACAGSLTAGGGIKQASQPVEPAAAPTSHAVAPRVPSGTAGARVRGRSAAAEPSGSRGERWHARARHERHARPQREHVAPRAAPPQAAPAPATAAPQPGPVSAERSLPTDAVIRSKPASPVAADRLLKPAPGLHG
jgi:hypothetical protein